MSSRRVDRATGPAVIVVLAALALAPVLLARGFVLIGDMSFVPEQPWKSAWLGLDGSVPRAVPADAFVSVLGQVVPGDLVQKAALFGALVLAGLGMYRLVRSLVAATARLAPLGAAVLYLWNPWVLERLAIGHWGLLLGYAALPWAARAAIRYRHQPDLSGLAALVLPLALASFGSPTGGILAAAVALLLVADRSAVRSTLVVAGAILVVNLPWLLPGLLGDAEPTDVSGVGAFAARSDSHLGTLGSVLSLGGIWKRAIVPGERDSVLLVGLAVLLSVAGLVHLARVARRARGTASPAARLLVLAGVGLLLALLPTFEIGNDLATWLVRNVPGAGILRDSQKWVALLALGVSVGFGLALDAGNRALRRSQLPARWIVAVIAMIPVVLLPSLAWGIAGKLDPVRYPAEWTQVRAILDDQPDSGRRMVALPFSAYQAFAWNDGRAALDPALRFFPGEVVVNDTLVVEGGQVVAGEDRAAARIAASLAAGDPLVPVLAATKVRYVLVERTAAGAGQIDDRDLVAAGRVLFDGEQLRLIDLGDGSVAPDRSYAALVMAGDVLALSALIASVFLSVRQIRGKKDNSG